MKGSLFSTNYFSFQYSVDFTEAVSRAIPMQTLLKRSRLIAAAFNPKHPFHPKHPFNLSSLMLVVFEMSTHLSVRSGKPKDREYPPNSAKTEHQGSKVERMLRMKRMLRIVPGVG